MFRKHGGILFEINVNVNHRIANIPIALMMKRGPIAINDVNCAMLSLLKCHIRKYTNYYGNMFLGKFMFY